jgi:hypothetical protein
MNEKPKMLVGYRECMTAFNYHFDRYLELMATDEDTQAWAITNKAKTIEEQFSRCDYRYTINWNKVYYILELQKWLGSMLSTLMHYWKRFIELDGRKG